MGRKSSCVTCTVLIVRNSSGGVSSTKTRLDSSFAPTGPIQRQRPAMKPMAIRRTTGMSAERTG